MAVATATLLGSLLLAFGAALREPVLPEPAMSIVVVYAGGFVASEIAVGVLFLLGFSRVFGARMEYGATHERSLDRGFVWLVLAIVLVYAANFTPVSGPTTASPSFAPTPLDPVGLTVRAAAALFVAVTLILCVAGLADPVQRRLLRLGTALGVLSSVGQTALMSMGSLTPSSPDSLPVAIVGVALVGSVLSVASLLSFILAYRGVRRNLLAGTIPRVFRPPWPAYYAPPPFGPGGPMPPPPKS